VNAFSKPFRQKLSCANMASANSASAALRQDWFGSQSDMPFSRPLDPKDPIVSPEIIVSPHSQAGAQKCPATPRSKTDTKRH
jgi:hypothetical protein